MLTIRSEAHLVLCQTRTNNRRTCAGDHCSLPIGVCTPCACNAAAMARRLLAPPACTWRTTASTSAAGAATWRLRACLAAAAIAAVAGVGEGLPRRTPCAFATAKAAHPYLDAGLYTRQAPDAAWLHIRSSKRQDGHKIFRAAADAQRIADYLLAFHPDYAARNNGGGEATADTGEGTGGSSELGDTLSEAA